MEKSIIALIAVLFLLFGGCTTTEPRTAPVPDEPRGISTVHAMRMPVRVTVYWAKGRGSDYWTRRYASSSGERLEEGVSAAADPSLFQYGTLVKLEGIGVREIVDTGTDVRNRTASLRMAKRINKEQYLDAKQFARLRSAPVIDLFFEHKADALKFAEASPPFVEATVVN